MSVTTPISDGQPGRPAPDLSPGIWRVSANAKLNLGLEILGRRSDGYHEIVSVTQQIALTDTVEYTPAGPFSVEMMPPLVGADENLAGRAARALADAAGIEPAGRLTIRKRIPLAAGLGGGSSDAAATLRLLAQVWGTGLGETRLTEIGAALGSDVPLFLAGATSLIRGRGDVVEPLPSPPTFWVVLATPAGSPPDKTRALYRALTPDDLTDGSATLALADRLRARHTIRHDRLVNGFGAAADRVYPDFAARRLELARLLGAPVHLTGAGPTLFALFDGPGPARLAARAAQSAGLWAVAASSTVRRPLIRASRAALAR